MSNDAIKYLVGEIFVVRHVGELSYIADQMGIPMGREEWEDLKGSIDAFFDTNPDEEIDRVQTEFCEKYFGGHKTEARLPKEKKPKKVRPGYIYLIHGKGTDWYKIGISEDPTSRIKGLGTKGPFENVLVKWFHVDDMKAHEEKWHARFKDKRVNGEWFSLSEEDIASFAY